jgi:nitric oxide reductase NorD protein
MSDTPLTVSEIEQILDGYLDPVLSSRRTARAPAQVLARFVRHQQEFLLRWVSIVAKTNAELAYQFAVRVADALKLMDLDGTEAWLIHAMDVYDSNGLYPAVAVLDNAHSYATELAAGARATRLDDVAAVLQLFIQGLAGRELKLEASDETYTDTETLFLPRRLSVFARRQDNFRLYKAMAAHQWAQTWYGTFRLQCNGGGTSFTGADGAGRLERVIASYDSPGKALRVFHALETVRLEGCIARALPGLYRDMRELQDLAGGHTYPAAWSIAIERLWRSDASTEDSYGFLPELYAVELPEPLCYQGRLFPERVEQAMRTRIVRERQAFKSALVRLMSERRPEDHEDTSERAQEQSSYQIQRNDIDRISDLRRADQLSLRLHLDGKTVAPPHHMRALMASILQDFGDNPPDYLTAAGDGDYHPSGGHEKSADDVWKGVYHEEGAYLYNEWDYRRQHYRKDWCVLRELDVHPREEPFVQTTLEKYGGLLSQLRKTFEALRGEDKLLKRQKNGDNVDLDALVEGYTDMRHGMELPERLFTKMHKVERNIAVLFMVDMSGSTKGWVNDAERESLVLLCEALEILGDRYAIYGFSGMTRKRCELFRVKRFDEPYSDKVKARITGMQPQDYTRMGVIIRHLSTLLNAVEARTKVLITLSDGKPDDYDGYRGEYGIEDTRQALIEAKQNGVHPFCITIDTEARDYLPHMYGAVNYTLVDDVRKLPLKVADIYRKLTF